MKPQARRGDATSSGRERIYIEHDSVRRPFMRGILVHSLMARGLAFDDAYARANAVRERLRGRGSVTVEDLGRAVQEVLRERSLPEEAAVPPIGPTIHVTTPAGAAPFSKGFLSQSLLAAAIEPNDAFDVAREIEAQLALRGVREIDRRELRRLAYQTLERRFGPRTAERYLVWRRYQEPDRPVILLLGGTAGRGQDVARARGRPPPRHPPRALDRRDPPDHAHHALARAGARHPRLVLRRQPRRSAAAKKP